MPNPFAWFARRPQPVRIAAIYSVLLVAQTVILFAKHRNGWADAALAMALIVAAMGLLFLTTQSREWRGHYRAAVITFVVALALYVEGFAVVYQTANHEVKGCFAPQLAHHIDALYFSLSTFSTAGFGDIHAAAPTCRWLVSGELMLDFSLIALAIAFFVARATRPSKPVGD